MKFITAEWNGYARLGILEEEGWIPLEALLKKEEYHPQTMEDLISHFGEETRLNWEARRRAWKQSGREELSLSGITFLPPLSRPEKILCVGLNYRDHVAEIQLGDLPSEPVIFSKFANALAAHEEALTLPSRGEQLDYEAELVVVIGREIKNASTEQAADAIFGYTVGNDYSLRDLQTRSSQWLIGKTGDQMAPIGPAITTADEVDPKHLRISCLHNGRLVQDANTSQMIFSPIDLVSYLSSLMTLKPGDIIFTGTPKGVIKGKAPEDQIWITEGDVIEVRIEGLGNLRNTWKR